MTFISIGLFAASIGCPVPQFFNKTEYPKNKFDSSQMLLAAKRCPDLYKDSPCLKSFTKVGKQDYQAICTKRVKND